MAARQTSENAGTIIGVIKYAKSIPKHLKFRLGVKCNVFGSSAAGFIRWRSSMKGNGAAGSVLTDTTDSMNNFSTGAVKFETGTSSSSNFSSQNISFLQCTNLSLPGVSVCQPIINTNPSSSNGGSSRKMLSNGLNRTIESNRALSLLSSQPAETREISLSPMVQSGTPPSVMPSLQHKDLGVGTILATNGSSNANRHGHGDFRTGQSGSSATATQHTLSFSRD